MTNPDHSFAASISDELNNTSDALQTLHDYANNNRTKQSHNTDSDTPRFTLAVFFKTVVITLLIFMPQLLYHEQDLM